MATKIHDRRWKSTVYIGIDTDGKRKYKAFYAETEDEADYLALAYKTGRIKDEKRIKLCDAMEEYISCREGILSPTTIRTYRIVQKYHFQSLMKTPINEITSRMIQNEIRHQMKNNRAPKTIKNNYMFLISVIKSYNRDAYFDVRLPIVPKQQYSTPDAETLTRIFKATEGTKVEVPVLLASWLSLRISEIMGLRWKDIRKDSISVEQVQVYSDTEGWVIKNTTKTRGSTRVIPLPEYIREKIEKLPREGERLFTGSNASMSWAYSKILMKNDIPHSRFHDLRHAFASHAAALNIPNRVIQEIGGWESDSVMQRVYQQSFTSEEAAAVEKLSAYYQSLMHTDLHTDEE